MNSSELENTPLAVRKFVFTYIDSVEQISILLLLRDNPSRNWTVEELTSQLRSSVSGIKKRLNELYERKVLQRDTSNDRYYRYLPFDEEIREEIEQLAVFNRTHPYKVLELIYSRQEKALQEFANAFKFKRDK